MIKIPDFKKASILIAGDLMLDSYWHGSASRISPEAPVPVINIQKKEFRVGGAGNVALNASTLGSNVKLMGMIGNDEAGLTLINLLKKSELILNIHQFNNCSTINKLRVLAHHHQVIRLDFEDFFYEANHDEFFKVFENELKGINVVVLSDYMKGTFRDISKYVRAVLNKGFKVLIDPKGSDYSKYKGATLITPNLAELEAVIGSSSSEEELQRKTIELRDSLNIEAILLTRSENGMTLFERGFDPVSIPTRAQEVFDVTGAGDTVISAMASAVSSGTSFREAMYIANYAAGVAVSKLGTSTVTLSELSGAIGLNERELNLGITSQEEIVQQIARSKLNGERVVMTNGCFDILHAGHVEYLQDAKKLGDRLIVAVNDDDSVRRLKGEDRPINPLDARMSVLSALGCVDWVVPFKEDTPEKLYAMLLPDVLVKGGDYLEDEVAGSTQVRNAGGEVYILPFKDGHSTTKIIARIQQQALGKENVLFCNANSNN